MPGNFASRRVAAAVGPAWQLHERRPWSYPHRGLSECRSARAWPWEGMWMSVAAVGKRPQNARIHAYQALVEADRASLRRLKNGYHARKMLLVPQRRRGLTCHTLGRCTRHEMRLCATGALPARSSRTMTWQNFERVEGLAGSGREVCRGGIHPGDLLVGYGQENRGRTRTFATSDWLRMGLRRRTLK